MGTEEKMWSMLFLQLSWRLAARNGDQPQRFLITDGFARVNSDGKQTAPGERVRQATCSCVSHALSGTEAVAGERGEVSDPLNPSMCKEVLTTSTQLCWLLSPQIGSHVDPKGYLGLVLSPMWLTRISLRVLLHCCPCRAQIYLSHRSSTDRHPGVFQPSKVR